MVTRLVAIGLALAPVVAAAQPPGVARPPIRIVAPAAPGGGWDQTARVMQQVLQEEGLASLVTVENVPGAAGTIGLARFITGARPAEPALLVTGLVMLSAIVANRSPVTLDQVTPIARLTGEFEVVAVPARSPLRTMDDLVASLRASPGGVSWAGGSAGGTDQILVALIARAAGVPPARTNYIAFAGGGEALAALLGGQVTAGVSGYAEFAPQIAAGMLRPLAISAPARVPGIDIPALRDIGLAVDLANWRGVVAPPGVDAQTRAHLLDTVERLRHAAGWRAALARFGWIDLYLSGDAFESFLQREQRRVDAVVEDLRRADDAGALARAGGWVFPAIIGVGLLVIGIGLAVERVRAHRGEPAPVRASDTAGHRAAIGWLATGAAAQLALMETAGFVVASTVLFWTTTRAFGSRRWLRDFVVAMLLAVAAWIGFTRGLTLSLPAGWLGGLL